MIKLSSKYCVILLFCVLFACKKENNLPKPIADFFIDIKSCQNDSCMVYFYDNSIYSDSREWNFGNGQTSQLIVDSSKFKYEDSYVVSLKVFNSENAEDNKTKKIQL